MKVTILFVVAITVAWGQPDARMRLEDFETMALRLHPSLHAASASVRTAEAMLRQANLYPNPTVGYTGDEISQGPVFRGGEHGVFAEQRILTAGKRGIARRIAEQDVTQAQTRTEMEKQRVLNHVRLLFYQALGEQRLLEVRSELAKLAQRAVQTTKELANVGQADRPDVLAVDIEAQRLELGLTTAENALNRTWRQLAAATGNPGLQRTPVEGNLDEIPKLSFEEALETLYTRSPELRIAEVETARSALTVNQAKADVIPDLFLRGGMHYNRERLELDGRPAGVQGSVEIGVQIPIFNRNQGTIAAARSEVERAKFAVEQTRLGLRARLASVFREYQDSVAAVERYRSIMIPRAQQAYDLYSTSFRQMAAAYPQVIITQRNLFQLQEDYVAAMVNAWQRSIEIQGLLVGAGTTLD